MDIDRDRDDKQNSEAEPGGPERTLAWLKRLQGAMGDVRIHDTAQAGALARRLGARAFTVGRDIYVRPELVKPMSGQGAALLAHELSHVAEQSGRKRTGAPLSTPLAQRSRQTSDKLPVQRQDESSAQTQAASTSGSEAAAQQTESAILKASTRQDTGEEELSVDHEEVADRVYKLMMRDIILDGERRAGGW